MVSITFPLDKKLVSIIERFPWVHWSELAREKIMKREIFEEFIKTGKLSKEGEKFCDSINWYPIAELEVRDEYIEKLTKIGKGPHTRMTLKKLDKWLSLKWLSNLISLQIWRRCLINSGKKIGHLQLLSERRFNKL